MNSGESAGPGTTLADVLFAWRRLLIVVPVVVAVVAVAGSLVMPSWYASTAVVMPPDEDSSPLGILDVFSQFRGGGAGGAGRAAQRLLSRTPAVDLVLGVLKSRRLRATVVDRFELVESYHAKSREHAIKELAKHVEVGTTPEGLIEVRVEDKDKQRAADMANTFVELLDQFNRETGVENARRTLDFIDSCLEENSTRLGAAAQRLREYQETHDAIDLSEQTRVTVEALADLQAKKEELVIRKRIMERYVAPDQREVQRLEAEIEEVTRSIDQLRGGRFSKAARDSSPGEDASRDGVFLPLGEIPSLGLEFAELKREVLVQEKVYELLTAQYEEARIRHNRDQATITVLDEAVPPPRKSRPRRSILVLASVFVAFAGSVAFALSAEGLLDLTKRRSADTELARSLGPLARRLQQIRDWSSIPRRTA